MMAAVGVRHPGFENFSCLVQHIKTGTVYKPDFKKYKIYQKYQAIYDKLYDSTCELMHMMTEEQ